MDDLVKRLLREEPIGMLSGCMDTVRYVNPDGPDAVEALTAAQAEAEKLRGELVEMRASLLIAMNDLQAHKDALAQSECKK